MKEKSKSRGAKVLLAVLLALCLAFTAFAFTACGPKDGDDDTDKPGEKTVSSIEITTLPTKTEYVAGVDTELDLSGGKITVKYSDNTSEEIDMTAEGVTTSNVTLDITGQGATSEKKNVVITYETKKDTFEITVVANFISVTFDWCYEGDEDVVQGVEAGARVRRPSETPAREGFTFVDWYADAAYTTLFDFAAPIQGDTTIYALWTDDSKTYYDVAFDLNYSGAPEAAVQKIESGKTASKPMNDPTRSGYTFNGWFADAEGETAFDFATAISAATTVYAGWTREAGGVTEYVFEAENTDLTGKSYPGLSGMASEIGLIQNYTTNTLGEALNASEGRYIGYMTEEGASITFNIVSDMEVDDAKLVVRLSKELCDYTLSPDNYSIELNAIPFSGWGPIEFKNVPAQEGAADVSNCYALPFQDYVIAENVHLKEGVNSINLIVMNSDPIAGTTITANGPLIDCIKITTSAVLDWSAAHGLPKPNV